MLQLAVAGSVFLLDMVHLPRRVKEESLRQFVSDVFGSRQSLKLGMWDMWGVGVGGGGGGRWWGDGRGQKLNEWIHITVQ